MDKLHPLPGCNPSMACGAMKCRSKLPIDQLNKSKYAIGSSLFSMTFGGYSKDEQHKHSALSSNMLIFSSDSDIVTSQFSFLLLSCGYWDEMVKVHKMVKVHTTKFLHSC